MATRSRFGGGFRQHGSGGGSRCKPVAVVRWSYSIGRREVEIVGEFRDEAPPCCTLHHDPRPARYLEYSPGKTSGRHTIGGQATPCTDKLLLWISHAFPRHYSSPSPYERRFPFRSVGYCRIVVERGQLAGYRPVEWRTRPAAAIQLRRHAGRKSGS